MADSAAVRVLDSQQDRADVVDPLAAITSQADKIRYACERVPQPPKTEAVRDWLSARGVQTRRSYASGIVTAWRRERDLLDTGPIPVMTPDVLAHLDSVTNDDVGQDLAEPDEDGRAERDPVAEPVLDASGERRVSTWVFVLGALVGLVVSVDTSWRFFGSKLGVSNVLERIAMFAGMEIVLVACGVAMFEGVRRRGGTPGPARWLAWALCGASAYAALVLSGPFLGVARVVFGPVLSVVALHFALGVELRARGARRTGAVARIGRELRERFLSRFGLADDDRDALTRTRDRAARRVARLALAPSWTPWRKSRLDRNLRKSHAAHDPEARARMLAELSAVRHAGDLRDLTQASPWGP